MVFSNRIKIQYRDLPPMDILWVYMRPTMPHSSVCLQESSFFQELKSSQPFFLMAGPNVVESEEHALFMAGHLQAIAGALGIKLVYKSSFDKANRTSASSFRGPGLIEGLR